ncbi:MAG: NnrS family protein [Woeseiaceae bacterium]
MRKPGVLFSLGFRPFYLVGALFAIVAVVFWLLSYSGVFFAGGYLRGIFWHSHEMVFGFALAVMAGFLLTAVRNWTGLPTPTGASLAALAALWLAGRALTVTGPPLLAAVVDIAFVPALVIAIALPIFRSRNGRNYKIVGLLLLVCVTNIVYHLASLGPLPAWLAYTTVITAVDLITIIYAIVAGRVIPAFTRNAIPGSEPQLVGALEFLAFASLVLIIVLRVVGDWVPVPAIAPTTLIVIAALSHAFRLSLWQPQTTANNTLLWMLPVAYSWLPIALFLRAFAQYSIVGQAVWIHALTMGAISSLMLAMMMRSSLGHTGRSLVASGADMSAFLLVQLATIVRVAAGVFPDAYYRTAVITSGIVWVLAFGVFITRYAPMLFRPRVDEKPG